MSDIQTSILKFQLYYSWYVSNAYKTKGIDIEKTLFKSHSNSSSFRKKKKIIKRRVQHWSSFLSASTGAEI